MKKEEGVFIEHIIDNIEKIESFTKNISKKSFLENEEKQYAVIRAIEIIGEAVKNLPSLFREKYPKVPWIKIAGMRDKITHHYFGIDLNAVWKVVKEGVLDLKTKILNIKNDLEKEE